MVPSSARPYSSAAPDRGEGEPPVHAMLPLLEVSNFPGIRRERLGTLLVNLGYKCNQSCVHCQVYAGPTRTEEVVRATVRTVRCDLDASGVRTLDVTGGAP